MNVPKLGAQWNNYLYRYDQLNRLTALTVLRQSQAGGSLTLSAEHNEGFTYDGNGNILTAYRNGTATGSPLAMDNLSYSYNRDQFGRLQNNKLNYLTDQVPAGNYATDLDSQLPDNYKYDAIGNLTQDVQAGLTSVDWTVYGKIRSITNSAGLLSYSYDAGGNRVSKATSSLSTYYVRDAQGNPLAVYETTPGGTTTWREQQLYGSSRLGLWQPNVNLANGNVTTTWNTLGNKRYELTNHLGNVLATITDRRLQHSSNSTTVDYYDAEVTSAQDYYAFGALQPGRQVATDTYRYGFNGKENDNDAGKGLGNEQDYGMRIYDPRIARVLSVDPLTKNYPWYTPYQFAANSPIAGLDKDGGEFKFYLIRLINENGTVKIKTTNVVTINDPLSFKVSINDAPPTEISPNLKDYGIQLNFVEYKGSFVSMPKGYSPKNLPDLNDPAWKQTISYDKAKKVLDGVNSLKGLLHIESLEDIPKLITDQIKDKVDGVGKEVAAKIILVKEEFTIPNAHFVSRHGAGTTLAEQYNRATTGVTPDGKQGRPVNASRFISNVIQLEALNKAKQIYNTTGKTSFTFDMGYTVGEGYLKGGDNGHVTTTSDVQAVFRNGQPYTLYPELKK
ncbi:hypothetical protein GCM10027037_26800 [Mucilaginibacter koreensis]